MNYSKAAYVKFDDDEALVKSLKTIMQTYDMEFDGVQDNKYSFDRYGEYNRSFIIKQTLNGWITILDDDGDNSEQLCGELSKSLSCFILIIGFRKDVLYYTVYDNGEQTGQYMSSLKYYEYRIDDDVEAMYKGDAEAFRGVMDDEGIEKLESILQGCREGSINKDEGLYSIQKLLGMIQDDDEPDGLDEESSDENGEDVLEQDSSLFQDIFYVDFKSINVKTDDMEGVISAVEDICGEMGYAKTDQFSKGEKKGFFKRMISSVKETKRIQFYISGPLDGWVTLVGEMEKLYGGEPSEWEFIHIEDKLSKMLDAKVIEINADADVWGFQVFDKGEKVYEYRLGDTVYIEDIEGIFPELKEECINDIFDAGVGNAKDVDNVLGLFCSNLGIKNYKINIPMDYSEDEYYNNVLKLLPGCDGFINLKFEPEN